ncbi:MAG: ATP-binding protein [Xanthomonadales bacterium]|nr:ATP-binding protein [Xanthomonadales bacterium]
MSPSRGAGAAVGRGGAAEPPSKRRPASLRLRLILFSTITLLVSLGVVGLALDNAYRQGAETTLRQQLDTWAYGVMAAMEVNSEREIVLSVQPADPLLLQPASGVYAQIEGDKDRWRSASALGVELPITTRLPAGEAAMIPATDDMPFYRRAFGLDWQLEDGSVEPLTVTALAHRDFLAPALDAFRDGLWKSLGAAAVLLVLAQAVFAAISLRPLRQVAADVAAVESGAETRLHGPYPVELDPLTRNIDRLLDTEQANQARYRSALDSLAHSLKTPLAVLKAGAPGDASSAATRQAIEDMERLIATRLERAAAGTRRALATPVDVAPAAERIAESLRKVHSQDLRTLECIIEPGVQFFGESRDLMELLGNLLDNACKYGNGAVRLAVASLPAAAPGARSGLRITVGNDGAPAPLGDFVQRGRRGDEQADGHGLGLAIVSELVSAYGGRLDFGHSDLGGAEVVVTIPPEGEAKPG